MEFTNALQLKAFTQGATAQQVNAARALVALDLSAGVLVACESAWPDVFAEAVALADLHTATMGCRSLDILHCAVAHRLAATEFVTTDSRQRKLATAMGLKVITF